MSPWQVLKRLITNDVAVIPRKILVGLDYVEGHGREIALNTYFTSSADFFPGAKIDIKKSPIT